MADYPKIERGPIHDRALAEYPPQYYLEWRDEYGCWHGCTRGFQAMSEALGWPFPGTKSESESDDKPNCIAWPLDDGFQLARFGDADEPTWDKSAAGKPVAYLRAPQFDTVCQENGGTALPDSKGYQFRTRDAFLAAIMALGAAEPAYLYDDRPMDLAQKNGQLVVTAKKKQSDDPLVGWAQLSGNRVSLVLRTKQTAKPRAVQNPIMYLEANGSPAGHLLTRPDGSMSRISRQTAKDVLAAEGIMGEDSNAVLGGLAKRPRAIACVPFGPPILPDGRVNIDAAKHIEPVEGEHPHCDMVLAHLGRDLDAACEPYAKHGITDGAAYLRKWAARLFRYPTEPLPYLFFHGPQGCGKSSFADLLTFMLIRGWASGSRALGENFNGAMENAILCIVEETDLQVRGALAKLKHYVTESWLPIRRMCTDEYVVDNLSHWIHNANSARAVPVLPGDRRIVPIRVSPFGDVGVTEIYRPTFRKALRDEAKHFLHTLKQEPLPADPLGRLWLPVLESKTKQDLMESSSPVAEFYGAMVVEAVGQKISRAKVFESFDQWRRANGIEDVTSTKFYRDFNELTDSKHDGSPEWIGGKKVAQYHGIQLRKDNE